MTHEVAARTSVTGIIVCESKIPMLADARPETPICRKPSVADALPMLRSNGTRASAAAFRIGQSQAGQRNEQQHQRGWQAEPAEHRSHQKQQLPPDATRARWRPKNPFAGKFAKQKDVDLVATDETGGQSGKNGAKLLRADVKDFHEDDGRTGHINPAARKGGEQHRRVHKL